MKAIGEVFAQPCSFFRSKLGITIALAVGVVIGCTVISSASFFCHPTYRERGARLDMLYKSMTPLEHAITDRRSTSDGGLEIVKQMVESGVDLNHATDWGTPLDVAVEFGNKPVAEYLLKHGAVHSDFVWAAIARQEPPTMLWKAAGLPHWLQDRQPTDDDGGFERIPKTTLDVAVFWHNVPAVKCLLTANGGVHANFAPGIRYDDPLFIAAHNDDAELVDLLLKNGSEAGWSWLGPDEYSSPIREACKRGSKKTVSCFLDHELNHFPSRDIAQIKNYPRLMAVAARAGNLSALASLIERGADPNLCWKDPRRDANQLSPLTAAFSQRHLGAALFLLRHGEMVGSSEQDQTAAFFGAYEESDDGVLVPPSELVEEFCKHGLKANGYHDREPYLHHAIYYSPEIAKVLIKYGADVNARDDKQRTALMVASSKANVEAIRLLLDHGANVNAVDNEHSTALHQAAPQLHKNEQDGAKQCQALKVLLEHGAKPNIKDSSGNTPLAEVRAAEIRADQVDRGWDELNKWNKEAQRLLIAHGAK